MTALHYCTWNNRARYYSWQNALQMRFVTIRPIWYLYGMLNIFVVFYIWHLQTSHSGIHWYKEKEGDYGYHLFFYCRYGAETND